MENNLCVAVFPFLGELNLPGRGSPWSRLWWRDGSAGSWALANGLVPLLHHAPRGGSVSVIRRVVAI